MNPTDPLLAVLRSLDEKFDCLLLAFAALLVGAGLLFVVTQFVAGLFGYNRK